MRPRVLVVGGGISGLASAAALRDRGCDPLVLESAERAGGTVRTERAEGHVFETGPVGFLDREPATLERLDHLGATPRLVRASHTAEQRWIWRRERLHVLPRSPGGFLASGLLSPLGRARVLFEPFARGAPDAEETVADFGRRRIGKEAVRTLLDPMVSGIFGGDVEKLSMPAAFPRMVALEREHGSLLRAMRALAREKRRAGTKVAGGPAGPGGTLTSMAGGMSEVIGVFAQALGPSLRTGAKVEGIAQVGKRLAVTLGGGETIEGDALLLAIPSYAAARLLDDLTPEGAATLEAIPYASIALVLLGFLRADVRHPLDGFGFLAPRDTGLRALGALVTSTIFDGRAPEGQVQIDVRIGGATDSEAVALADDQLVSIAQKALARTFGIDAEPTFRRVWRHPRGIPQYLVGHLERVAQAERAVERVGGLFLTGNALHGVGFNDCVREAERVAERIAASLGVAPAR